VSVGGGRTEGEEERKEEENPRSSSEGKEATDDQRLPAADLLSPNRCGDRPEKRSNLVDGCVEEQVRVRREESAKKKKRTTYRRSRREGSNCWPAKERSRGSKFRQYWTGRVRKQENRTRERFDEGVERDLVSARVRK